MGESKRNQRERGKSTQGNEAGRGASKEPSKTQSHGPPKGQREKAYLDTQPML